MDSINPSLFGTGANESPAALAASLAPPAAAGRFDELRGAATPPSSSAGPVRLLDTRPGPLGAAEGAFGGSGRTTPIPAGGSLRLQVAGKEARK